MNKIKTISLKRSAKFCAKMKRALYINLAKSNSQRNGFLLKIFGYSLLLETSKLHLRSTYQSTFLNQHMLIQ